MSFIQICQLASLGLVVRVQAGFFWLLLGCAAVDWILILACLSRHSFASIFAHFLIFILDDQFGSVALRGRLTLRAIINIHGSHHGQGVDTCRSSLLFVKLGWIRLVSLL